MNKILHYFQMTRPLNVLLSGITVFIAAYILNKYTHPLLWAIITVVMLFCSFANIINDLFDLNTDRINNPKKYFKNLLLNNFILLAILLLLLITSLILAHTYFPQYAIFYLYLIFTLIILYTPYLKGIPLLGNIIISFILASVFIITELVLLNSFSGLLLYPVILTFLLTLIREIIKDIDDLKGDVAAGINTFPVIYGLNCTKYLLLILITLLIVISIYPYYLGIYNFQYLVSLVLLVQIPLIGCIFYLWKYPNFQNRRTLTIATKYITIGGVITILFTKLLG